MRAWGHVGGRATSRCSSRGRYGPPYGRPTATARRDAVAAAKRDDRPYETGRDGFVPPRRRRGRVIADLLETPRCHLVRRRHGGSVRVLADRPLRIRDPHARPRRVRGRHRCPDRPRSLRHRPDQDGQLGRPSILSREPPRRPRRPGRDLRTGRRRRPLEAVESPRHRRRTGSRTRTREHRTRRTHRRRPVRTPRQRRGVGHLATPPSKRDLRHAGFGLTAAADLRSTVVPDASYVFASRQSKSATGRRFESSHPTVSTHCSSGAAGTGEVPPALAAESRAVCTPFQFRDSFPAVDRRRVVPFVVAQI